MLTINERRVGDVAVLSVCGTIESGAPAEALDGAVRHELACGRRRLVVDLADATSSDASGVSALLGAKLAALEVGAEMVLANATSRLDDMLISVALMRYFDVFETTELALARFGLAPAERGDDSGAIHVVARTA